MNEDTDTTNDTLTTTALAITPAPFRALSFSATMALAEVLARSGYFRDTRTAAQAAAKIFAGAEYQIPPMIALQNVYVIDGKTALSDVLIGMLIERSDLYDYRVIVSTDKECRIAFFRGGELRGTQTWTIGQARDAGLLSKDNWRKYPEAMLYARALSAGTKKYIPGVLLGGAVYTPDELTPDAEEGTWQEVSEPDLLTPEQRNAINAAFAALGWNAPQRGEWLRTRFGKGLAALSGVEADQALNMLALRATDTAEDVVDAPEPPAEPEPEADTSAA